MPSRGSWENFSHTYNFYFLIASDSVAYTFQKPILYRHAHTHNFFYSHMCTCTNKKGFLCNYHFKNCLHAPYFFPLPYHIHQTLDCCFFWIASCNENCLVFRDGARREWGWKKKRFIENSDLDYWNFLFYFNFLVH